MAKLARKTQKIFAGNASNDQITAFGTAKNSSPTYTTDIGTIQNTNFTNGWSSAIQDDYAPYREDRNGVDRVTTQQLAYLFETGTPEYDSGTNYCLGADCKVIESNGTFKIYRSIKADNTNHAVSDTGWWQLVWNSDWLTGVTSNIQAQLNGKQATGSYATTNTAQTISGNKTFSGSTSLATATVTAPAESDSSARVVSSAWVNNRIMSIINTYFTPKYSSMISISSGWTATANGICYLTQTAGNVATTINVAGKNILTMNGHSGSSHGKPRPCATVIIGKGQVITFANVASAYFVPFG